MPKKTKEENSDHSLKKDIDNKDVHIQQDIVKWTPAIQRAVQRSKEIPDEEKPTIIEGIGVSYKKFEYQSGPLPSPQILQGYKDCDPKVLSHVLDTAKKEQKHRHLMDNKQAEAFSKSIEYNDKTKRVVVISAQLCSIFVVLIFLAAAVVLALKGMTGLAIGSFLGSMVSVVAIIITGKREDAKKKSKKRK